MTIATYVTSKIQKQSLTHAWRTSIQETIVGGEKRSALFTWPRITLDNELRCIDADERNFIRTSFYQNIHNLWGFPFVHDKTKLTSQASSGQKILALAETSYRHFYDGRGLVLIDPSDWKSYEYCVIDTVDSDTQITVTTNLSNSWSSNTCVYPLYEYRIQDNQELSLSFRQLNSSSIVASEAFEDTRSFSYSIPSSGAVVYDGLDLFLTKPMYPMTEKYSHPYERILHLGLGFVSSNYQQTRCSFEMDFTLVSRSVIWNLLKFFDSKQGRLQTFYAPSWNNDIVPTTAIGSADTTITIEQTSLLATEIEGRHLFIRLPDGSYVCREITELISTTSIRISSSIGTSISQQNLSKMLISFLYKVRFDIDEIVLDYISDEIVTIKLGFKSTL